MKDCLIVDDSKVVRDILKKMLDQLGFECRQAVDGKDAVDLCTNKMPDLILLDWNMPIMSGIECLTVIRSMEGGKHPKIILCTGNSEMTQIVDALSGGADEYIIKPFDPEILRLKLVEVEAI
jgi:two-component system chemotaxis response regulator CheY